MIKVIGVRFRIAGKIYYFDPKEFEVKRGSHVIVETVRGIEYGTVITGPKEVPEEEVVTPLKEVLRVATPEDEEREWINRAREKEAYQVCKEKIYEHGLDMKLIRAEYTFDNNKLLFYFTADGRIDFRELVKDLAGIFRTRIELRQVGVRDETKLLGGLGICGRELCCHTFLSDFAPVSIKMAKEQNLSLNPNKISGVCGRLMCCLKNEAETYEYLNSKLPRNGDSVSTNDGLYGTVRSVNVLKQTVKVLIEENDEKTIREYPVEEIRFRPKKKGKGRSPEQFEGEDGWITGERTELTDRSEVVSEKMPAEWTESAGSAKNEEPKNRSSRNRRNRNHKKQAAAEGSVKDTAKDGIKDGSKEQSTAENKETGDAAKKKRKSRNRRSRNRRPDGGRKNQANPAERNHSSNDRSSSE